MSEHLTFVDETPKDRRRSARFVCRDTLTGSELASIEKKHLTPADWMKFMAQCYEDFPATPRLPMFDD